MEYEQITYAVADGVLTLVLDRPERLNAFTPRMGDELRDAFDRSDTDGDVRAVVVTGSGRAFCAGADLSGGGATFDHGGDGGTDGEDGPAAPESRRDGGGRLALRIFESTKPVIGAVNGPAVGVGATMTLPMDVRLASDTARFGFVFARRGIVPEAASSWFLPRVVGISRAVEWAVTGRVFGADEAREAGLVRSVHAPDDLLPAAHALAAEIAENAAPVSVALARQMMWRMLGAAHPMDAHELDSWAMVHRGRSADAAEGVGAFLEKRPARFPGRVPDDLPPGYPWWPDRPYRPVT